MRLLFGCKRVRFNQLTVIDEYTRHKYMELTIVATVNWLKYKWVVNFSKDMVGNIFDIELEIVPTV